MKKLVRTVLVGALVTFFFDPNQGSRRRKMLVDRLLAAFRGTRRGAEQAGRGVAADAYGVSQSITHRQEEPKEYDDATLARKVESEIFREADAPKGQVDVNAENGVVILRGEVQRRELIDDLVAKARSVQGVKDVESLLHTPGEPAPMHERHEQTT